VENFDGENVDELIKIRQIHQYFPPSKFCAIRYISNCYHQAIAYVTTTYWDSKLRP